METLYPLMEVEKVWKISRKRLMSAIDKGDLSAISVGRNYFFTEAQLSKFLERRTLSKPKK